MRYLGLCIQLFFFLNDNVRSLSGQNFKKVNIKNNKMNYQPLLGYAFLFSLISVAPTSGIL